MRKYQTGGLVDVFDIRSELYDLRNLVQEWSNNHLADVTNREGVGHDRDACSICRERAAEMKALDMAIRRFGGSPRR